MFSFLHPTKKEMYFISVVLLNHYNYDYQLIYQRQKLNMEGVLIEEKQK